MIGRTHLQQSRRNEDSFGYVDRAGVTYLAVADGAGSASHAALGSRTAVTATLTALSSAEGGAPSLEEAVWAARRAVAELCDAIRPDMGMDAFATTLAVCAVRATLGGLAESESLLVGNGATLLAAPQDGALQLDVEVGRTFLTWPKGEVALTRHEKAVSAGGWVMLATDGLWADLQQEHAIAAWFFDSLEEARDSEGLARCLDYHLEGSGDDRTFLALRTPEAT